MKNNIFQEIYNVSNQMEKLQSKVEQRLIDKNISIEERWMLFISLPYWMKYHDSLDTFVEYILDADGIDIRESTIKFFINE